MGPKASAAVGHGGDGGEAHEGPEVGVEGREGRNRRGGSEEPDVGLGGGEVEGGGKLCADSNCHRAVPETVVAAGAGGRGGTAGAEPRADVAAGERIESQAPQRLFEGVGAGEAPRTGEGRVEGAEGAGHRDVGAEGERLAEVG